MITYSYIPHLPFHMLIKYELIVHKLRKFMYDTTSSLNNYKNYSRTSTVVKEFISTSLSTSLKYLGKTETLNYKNFKIIQIFISLKQPVKNNNKKTRL